MIVVRDVFQAKYGKADELVAIFMEARKDWPVEYGLKVLTDRSGPFFTVVTESEFENLGDWEETASRIFALPEFGRWFEKMMPLVESGRREFYNVE